MARETTSKKRTREETAVRCPPKTAKAEPGAANEMDAELDDFHDQKVHLSSDIKGILAALHQVRQKAKCDEQKRSEELLNSVSAGIQSLVEEAKKKAERERQSVANTACKVCREFETALKDEADKYKQAYEAFCSAKDLHLQAYEDIFTKLEDTKEKLLLKCEQQRKKEKVVLTELQKSCTEKITETDNFLKTKKEDEKSLHMLRKSLGSILESDAGDSDDDLDLENL